MNCLEPVHFILFPNDPENQNFEKMEKAPGDLLILQHMCIKNHDMIYAS